MKPYLLKNGNAIFPGDLRRLEDEGVSEAKIAKEYGISRQHLYNIRKKLKCSVRFRSDRGVDRKSSEERQSRRAENARRRYIPKESELRHCHFCKKAITAENFCLEANERAVCRDCAVKNFEGQEIVEAVSKSMYIEEDDNS